MPVRIDVIDSTQRDNGFLRGQRLVHPHAVHCSDLATMVLGVIERAAGQQIERLRIFGHGNVGMQNVGGGTHSAVHQIIALNDDCSLHNSYLLSMLCGCFTRDAVVELHGCRVGSGWRGSLLLYHLANLWQVRVRAAHTRQFADWNTRFEGHTYTEADGRPGSLIPLRDRPTH